MYAEEIRMPPGLVARFAVPIVVVLVLLVAALALLPVSAPVRLVIGMVGLLYLVAAGLFVYALSALRIAIDDRTLTVAFRILIKRRFPLVQIANCAPISAPIRSLTYLRAGLPFRSSQEGGRAVFIRLKDGTQVAFPSATPAAVCAALRTRYPAIAEATAEDFERPGWNAPAGSARAAAEAESREWQARCPHCGYEASAWDRGWTIWKGAGNSRKYLRCPNCGKLGWHTIQRQRDDAGT